VIVSAIAIEPNTIPTEYETIYYTHLFLIALLDRFFVLKLCSTTLAVTHRLPTLCSTTHRWPCRRPDDPDLATPQGYPVAATGGYPVDATLWLPCGYPVATLWLPCGYPVATLWMLPCGYPVATLSPRITVAQSTNHNPLATL
jgi:hypothetical protein